jgi:glutamate racemase
MNLKAEQPIGIFDSGAGGLTVAAAVNNILPSEKLIYFGDTAHLPYGDKSTELIQFYSRNITDFLLEKNCKVILIACNTASAAAYETVKNHVGEKALVVNVIDPTAEYVARNENIKKIGVIGTKGTVNSGTYTRKIAEQNPVKQVFAIAAPLLVPMIEEGFIYDDISNAIIRSYLSNSDLNGIDALILGCTHYPIIKNQIRKFYNFKTEIIDSSDIVAKKLKTLLTVNNLLNNEIAPVHEFYVSDYTDFFKTLAEMFFDMKITLQKADIWNQESI